MYEIYIDRWLLPLTPREIKISSKNKNNDIALIDDGEFNLLKREGLKTINFEFILPAYKYPFGNYSMGYKNPKEFLAKLERLKKKKMPFQFIIVRKYPTGKNYFNTNIKVSLENYETKDTVEEFMDIVVSIELKEYKDPRMTVLERLEGELGAYVTMPRGITKVIDKIYQTKTGEFLWQIVRGQTGGLDRLGEIMNTNGLQTLNDKLPEVIRIGNK